MKGVIAAMLIAAAIVCGSFLYTNKMMKISSELLSINSSVEASLSSEDYAAASGEIQRLRDYITDKRTFLSATGNHARLDEIEMNVMELAGYAEGEQKTDAVAHCNQLSVMLEHLPRDYKITLENIL